MQCSEGGGVKETVVGHFRRHSEAASTALWVLTEEVRSFRVKTPHLRPHCALVALVDCGDLG
jgi:hypothetical protein